MLPDAAFALAAARRHCHVDRLADAQCTRFFRQRLDQEDELGAFLETIDHRRREFGLPGDETHARGEIAGAAVAADPNRVPVSDVRQYRLGREKTHFDIAGWQQGQHRPVGRHHFAGAEIDLLDSALDGTKDAAAREPRLRGVEPRLRIAQHRDRGIEILLRPGAAFCELARTIKGLPRICQRGLDLGEIGLLQVVVHREQSSPVFTVSPSRTESVCTRPTSSGATKMSSASIQP